MREPVRVVPGDAHEARRIGPVTQADIVRFAGAGGDFNPLHHDEAVARASGFGGVIAMGQFQAGALAGFLTDWVGVEHLRSLAVRFVSPLSIGEVVDLSARVIAVEHGIAEIALVAAVAERTVVTGTARAEVSAG